MDNQDLDVIKVIAAKNKMRYDDLDVNLPKKPGGTNCIVAIDFTAIAYDMMKFKESLIDDKDFEIHVAIEIMNTFAHYKHYFKSRDCNKVTVLGFVRSNNVFEMAENIFKIVVTLADYFPGVYMLSNIARGFHVHTIAGMIDYIKSVSLKDAQFSIYVISAVPIDKQLICIIPSYQAYFIHKGYEFQPTVFLSKEDYLKKIIKSEENYNLFSHKAELGYMNVCVGRYMNTLVFKHNKNVKFKRTKSKDKINHLNTFISSVYNPSIDVNMTKQFMSYLRETEEIPDNEQYENFTDYERCYDYRFQDTGMIKKILVPLFDNWRLKIKDYDMTRKSENYKILVEHDMQYNWLL